jgi:hypothetical protein
MFQRSTLMGNPLIGTKSYTLLHPRTCNIRQTQMSRANYMKLRFYGTCFCLVMGVELGLACYVKDIDLRCKRMVC